MLFHVGMARYMTGDEDGARTALARAAASTVDFPGKAEIAGCLAVLAVDPKSADAKATSIFCIAVTSLGPKSRISRSERQFPEIPRPAFYPIPRGRRKGADADCHPHYVYQ